MAKHCVLIVDDQRDIRRVLSAGLETIGQDIQVIDVPSGEEALLVLSNQSVDVLVTDVRLPGISGLELKERARQRNPDVDLILITGLSDPGIRQSIETAGVAAFFYKPVEMGEFLDAVKRCLERAESNSNQSQTFDKDSGVRPDQKEPLSLADELAELRQMMNANAVLLLDERGRSVAQAGEIPDVMNGGPFVSALLAASHAGAEISSQLGLLVPESFSAVRGLRADFLLAHVGPATTLLISLPAGFTARTLGERFVLMDKSVQKLLKIIQADVEKPAPEPVSQSIPEIPEIDELDELDVEEGPVLDEIFNQAGRETYKPEEVDAFWDSLVEGEKSEGVINANAISYEQARQLGLTPDNDRE